MTGSWGWRSSQRKLASFAHKARILSHMPWHRHSQTRASKAWTMKQTLARAKDLFFFPSAKPRSYSTLTYNLYVCWNFYRKVDFLCQGFGGRWLGGLCSLWPLPHGAQHMGQKYTISLFPSVSCLPPTFLPPSPSLSVTDTSGQPWAGHRDDDSSTCLPGLTVRQGRQERKPHDENIG